MNKSGTINESLETERYYPFLRKQCRSFFHLTRRQKLFISPSKESSTSRAEGLKRVKRVRERSDSRRERVAKGDTRGSGRKEHREGEWRSTRAKLVSRMNEGTSDDHDDVDDYCYDHDHDHDHED